MLFFTTTMSKINKQMTKTNWQSNVKGTLVKNNMIPGALESHIPLAYESSHCSFLEIIPNGDTICVWFSGTKEGQNRVAIVLSYLYKG